MTSLSDKQTLKILCLHGYRQTIDSFKSKSGGFRKLLKSRLQFGLYSPVIKTNTSLIVFSFALSQNLHSLFITVFIEGPHSVPTGDQNPNGEDCKSWWFSDQNPHYFSSAQESNICNGFDESLKLIENTFETQGPFDGILGFSQGSALVALLCCLKNLNEFKYDFKFVVLIAGFKSLSTKHLELFARLEDRLIDIPSLHIIGESDQIIAKTKSQHLMEYFENPFVVYHSGGHLVPSHSSNRQQFNEFFDRFI